MKFVFSASVLCLAFYLFNNCCGLQALFKRMPSSLVHVLSSDEGTHDITRRSSSESPARRVFAPNDGYDLGNVPKKRKHRKHGMTRRSSTRDTPRSKFVPNSAGPFIMPHDVDPTKSDTEVHNSDGEVAFSIPRQTNLGYFEIADSRGKAILKVMRDGQSNCKAGFSYTTADKKATFALNGNSGRWGVSFAGGVFTLDSLPAPSTMERNLVNSNGAIVDTIVKTGRSPQNGKFMDTIDQTADSSCPVQYTIALLLLAPHRMPQC